MRLLAATAGEVALQRLVVLSDPGSQTPVSSNACMLVSRKMDTLQGCLLKSPSDSNSGPMSASYSSSAW